MYVASLDTHRRTQSGTASIETVLVYAVCACALLVGGGVTNKSGDENHKFDVYLQWLEEQNKETGGGANGRMHGRQNSRNGGNMTAHQLLEDDMPSNAGCCAQLSTKCVIL